MGKIIGGEFRISSQLATMAKKTQSLDLQAGEVYCSTGRSALYAILCDIQCGGYCFQIIYVHQ